MIHRDSLTDDHLRQVAGQLTIRDRQLLGTMVHALYLVEQLALQGLEFTFKGGTCLSLIVDRLDRLSIDVDIEIYDAVSHADIESSLNQIVAGGGVFVRWEQNVRLRDVEGSRHYKLYYRRKGATDSARVEHILLDVVRAAAVHPSIEERDLVHTALVIEGSPVRIVTPTIEGLLGDKLTACAPLTVGVPIITTTVPGTVVVFNKYPEMIKQLFDVNVLIPFVKNWDDVGASFARTLHVQRDVFGQDFTMEQVVRDLSRRALAMFGLLDSEYHPDLDEAHAKGHQSLSSYIVDHRSFAFEDVKMAALRAAYVAHCLLAGQTPMMDFPSMTASTLESAQIKQVCKGLSKVKRPEAVAITGLLREVGYGID